MIAGEMNMKKCRTLFNLLFAIYVILMIWLLFIQRIKYISFENYGETLIHNLNIIPFRTIIEYINPDKEVLDHAIINLAGNIVMFIPLGFFLPAFNANCRKMGKLVLLTIIILIIVELIQLFSLTGSFDVDDIILNTIGSSIGYGIQHIIFKNNH